MDDQAISRRHLQVDEGSHVVVTDLGSRNGTAVGGRAIGSAVVAPGASVRIGGSRLEWRLDHDDVPAAIRVGLGACAGRVPFNRPPRAHPPVEPATLSVPAEPPPRPDPEPLSWAGIVLPIVAGAVIALLLSPIMAIFAGLGPLLTIGTWLERRRRATRTYRAACRLVDDEVQRLEAVLPGFQAEDHKRRLALMPDLGELVRRAEAPSVRCWERRLDDPDSMELGIGTADLVFDPPLSVAGDGGPAQAALDLIHELPSLSDAPVPVSLSAGHVVGIVGPVDVGRAVARSLLLQSAVVHGPADVAIVGLAIGNSPDWSWLRWLPHTADVVGGGQGALVATVPDEVSDVVSAVVADESARTRLILIDGAAPLVGRGAPGRALLAHPHASGVVVVDDAHHLPSSCTTIVEIDHRAGRLRLVDPRSSVVLEGVTAWGAPLDVCRDAASRLASLDDPDLGSASANVPDSVSLLDLIGDSLTPETVLRRWDRVRGTAQLSTPIGADDDGALELDFVADGPHVLLGGTTGSGKSELLRSMVAGLALSADPHHLAFVLIDYKGGAAFDRCSDLPHVAGMVTDLDDHLAERALRCLEAELRYREERLREFGAEDLLAYRSAAPADAEPLPRLVVVVDEFATLAGELPEFLDALVGIAQRGRSLGVHMVLATQRPAGVVTEDIRANTSCRIALRVTDRHDSNDVIDAPDAASIPRGRPGRALARFGPADLVAFQSALVTGITPPASAGLRVSVVDHDVSGVQSVGMVGDGVGDASGKNRDRAARSDLDRVVEAVLEAHHKLGGDKPRSPWPEPLPHDVDLDGLGAEVSLAGPAAGPAAWLIDDPDNQRRHIGGWAPQDGHLVAVGGPGSGTTTTLATVALDLVRTHSADDLHLYAIDLDGGGLDPLAALPHVGAVVAPVDAERRTRALRMIDDEVASRRADPAAAQHRPASFS